MPQSLTTFDQIVTQNEEMQECMAIARTDGWPRRGEVDPKGQGHIYNTDMRASVSECERFLHKRPLERWGSARA